MNKNINFAENEISLKEVFGHALKLWKKWLVIGVIFAVLLGMYKAVPLLKVYGNKENRNSYISSNKTSAEYLQKSISEIQYQISKQDEYFNNSIYININPLQEQRGSLSYYVSTDNDELKSNYSKDIVHAYKNLFDSGKVAEYVASNLSYNIEEEYVYELISVNLDESSKNDNYLDITVVNSDEQNLKEIMGLVQQYIEENKSIVSQQVGKYNMSLVSNSTTVLTDNDITTKRAELDATRTTLQASLNAKQGELSSVQSSNLSLSSIVKSSLKFVLIGFVAGIFVCFMCQLLYFILSNKIISANQLRDAIGVSVFGNFVEKKKYGKLEKVGYKLAGEELGADFDESLKISAYSMISSTHNKDIVIIDLAETVLSANILDKITQYDFMEGNNYIKDVNTLEKFDMLKNLKDTTAVVFIVKKVGTKLQRLEHEIRISKNYGSEFIGVILV